MLHVDGQQVVALSIVAVAALAVGRRMLGQIAGFWSTDKSSHCGGCEGCGPAKADAPATAPKLVQVQMRPPARIRRRPEK